MKNNTLKNIASFLFLVSFITLFSVSCSKNNNSTAIQQPKNYVVLLDLSDRLLSPNQANQDIEVITTVFGKFQYNVLRNLIVNSKDRFTIRIIHQQNSPLNVDSLNNILVLDMGSLHFSEKKKQLEQFEKRLKPTLKNLYKNAFQGNRHDYYQGVDIWKYFNENLQYDLLSGYKNHLVILTDGYFDFEKYNHTKKIKNRYSSTIFFKYLNKKNWKKYAETKNYGLIPIKKKFPKTTVTVVGINAKSQSLDETDKLTYFWKKWLKESGFDKCEIIKKNNAKVLKRILENKF